MPRGLRTMEGPHSFPGPSQSRGSLSQGLSLLLQTVTHSATPAQALLRCHLVRDCQS
jgi:hypothetical protein